MNFCEISRAIRTILRKLPRNPRNFPCNIPRNSQKNSTKCQDEWYIRQAPRIHSLQISAPGGRPMQISVYRSQIGVQRGKKHPCPLAGFHIPFENRLSCRATSVELRLPNKTFRLPDNINVKTYRNTFDCPVGQPPVNFWLPDRKKWLPRATGYVKPWLEKIMST